MMPFQLSSSNDRRSYDPTNLQSASVWHPLASRPDAGSFDGASSLLLRDQGGYWLPYRDCHAFLVAGDVNATVATITAYLLEVRAGD